MTGLPRFSIRSKHVLAAQRVLAAAGRRLHRQLVDVRAGDERFVAGAGQDDRPDRVVVLAAHSIARRSSSSVCVLSAFRTFGRLMVTVATRAVPFDQDVVESVESHDEGSSIPARVLLRARRVEPARTGAANRVAPRRCNRRARRSRSGAAARHERLVEFVATRRRASRGAIAAAARPPGHAAQPAAREARAAGTAPRMRVADRVPGLVGHAAGQRSEVRESRRRRR